MPAATLYPDLAPLRSRWLPVDGGHRLHVEEWGCVGGEPALVLHGGPGSGCTPLLRRYLDPARFRVICIDQRGAGRSEPRGGTAHNTTAELLADLRALREAMGVARWLVVGGSWGATLAIAHALDQPAAISGLLLRSTFLARASDIDGFFAAAPAPLAQGWRHFGEVDGDAQRALAIDWCGWERRMSGKPGEPAEPDAATLEALVARYRVQSHYLAQRCWLAAPPLLERVAALPRVPTLLLHGTADRVCPPDGAVALHGRLPHAGLRWAAGVGHDPAHPAMVDLMVTALDAFAAQGQFEARAHA